MRTYSVLFSMIFLSFSAAIAQNSLEKTISWQVFSERLPNIQSSHELFGFADANYLPSKGHLPMFVERIETPSGQKPVVKLEILESRSINNSKKAFPYAEYTESEFKYWVSSGIERGKKIHFVHIIPIRKNGGNKFDILEQFKFNITWIKDPQPVAASRSYKKANKTDSKLRNGRWYRISVNESGIYKLDKAFFDNNGISLDGVDVSKIAVFGNGGAELPLRNDADRNDDMVQIPSEAVGLSDGRFDDGDQILFYAEGPITWKLNNAGTVYRHLKHAYADEISYFVCVGEYVRSNVRGVSKINSSPSNTTNEYDLLRVHHIDRLTDISQNVKTGKEWFGEEFNFNTTQTIDLGTAQGLNTSKNVVIKSFVAARSLTSNSVFELQHGGRTIITHNCRTTGSDYLDPYVSTNVITVDTNLTSNNLSFVYNYRKGASSDVGWLNYLQVHGRAKLQYTNGGLLFRDREVMANPESVVQYEIDGSATDLKVWDVSDINDIRSYSLDRSGNRASFRTAGGSLREFIAFRNSDAKSPTFSAPVLNQNLHGMDFADVFIVAYDSFVDEATELGRFHTEREGYRVNIVTPKQIYNEFSSGTQDVAAIRDFLRYFYENASSDEEKPKYLILFGDASYDFKDRIIDNTNLVPSYQSNNSIDPTTSYVSDDFYGLLDPVEGNWESDYEVTHLLDIAIGRIPVATSYEAKNMVNKIKAYHAIESMGNWRNNLLFVGDDEDNNLHFRQTEELSNFIDTVYPLFNIKKIHFDAFVQEIGPGGAEYPEVEKQLTQSVQNGVLVVNYMGHGGELGWAHERVLDNTAIKSWTNINRQTLFVTATCEFSRFDDPQRVSAGENAFLNKNGGAIAMLTTTRVVYAGANAGLLNRLYKGNAFEPVDGQYRTLGEIIMTTKNKYTLTPNTRNFCLLGDPTIRLAYPNYRVATTSINGKTTNEVFTDTLKALSKVKITGIVTDVNGNKLNDFNGIVYPTIFDKPDTLSTLVNDPGSRVAKFATRKNIVYKGKASARNGDFQFEFVIPKDISYKFGNGKISYYAQDEEEDGNGSYFDFVIGGTAKDAIVDEQGPNADLYINDLEFAFGGISNENPIVIAKLSDDNGINTVGTGIGHELTLTLDDEDPIVVNDYYEAELDDYRRGTITYPMTGLEEGRHSVSIKVWDVANNSATAYTEFVVANSAEMALDHVLNYPNPFTTSTTFWVTHNRPGDVLDVTVQVFSISGRLVKTLKTSQVSQGSTFNEITWDGRDDFGNKIGRGVYVYKVNVKSSDGMSAEAMEKLVILN